MRAVFNRAQLLVLLQDFYQLTGLRAVVFDAWGMDILSYPKELPLYCRQIRRTPEGELGCRLCDQNACQRAMRQKKTLIYTCHAGLVEVIAPIQVQDATVGYLLLSHIVPETESAPGQRTAQEQAAADSTLEKSAAQDIDKSADRKPERADSSAETSDAAWERARECFLRYGLTEETMRPAYEALPRTGKETLRSAANLLTLAARSLYQERLAALAPGSVQERLNCFLDDHLHEELPSERICRELAIGRTSLYHLAREMYGCGISEHITHLRIQRAIRLLTQTQLSNSEICQQIGVSDYNYFFRLFRRQTGLTPGMYREQLAQERR
ncbi:MAG: PocR ligand-binding domain-containing protein [Eubacteriales bacterium]|nr:PocR ligand-binding domain-containing protein [Eubacteriales bacterium]